MTSVGPSDHSVYIPVTVTMNPSEMMFGSTKHTGKRKTPEKEEERDNAVKCRKYRKETLKQIEEEKRDLIKLEDDNKALRKEEQEVKQRLKEMQEVYLKMISQGKILYQENPTISTANSEISVIQTNVSPISSYPEMVNVARCPPTPIQYIHADGSSPSAGSTVQSSPSRSPNGQQFFSEGVLNSPLRALTPPFIRTECTLSLRTENLDHQWGPSSWGDVASPPASFDLPKDIPLEENNESCLEDLYEIIRLEERSCGNF